MSRAIAAILVVHLASPTIAAAAEENWICSYPSVWDGRPVIIRYIQKGDFMVEDNPLGMRYRILENNQFGLMASWSASMGHGAIGTRTLIIDKRTGEFVVSNLFLNGGKINAPDEGTCIRG